MLQTKKRYAVYAKDDMLFRGRNLRKGDGITCCFCGENNWIERELSYVCQHGRVEYFEALIMQDTVARRLVV
jgi:hypothetical protein